MQDQVRVDVTQAFRHDCRLASAGGGDQRPDLTVPVGDVKGISVHDRHFPDTGAGDHFRRDPADAPQPDHQHMGLEQPFCGILSQQQFCPALPVICVHHKKILLKFSFTAAQRSSTGMPRMEAASA